MSQHPEDIGPDPYYGDFTDYGLDVEGDCGWCAGAGVIVCDSCQGSGCRRCCDGERTCPQCGGSGFDEDDHSWTYDG